MRLRLSKRATAAINERRNSRGGTPSGNNLSLCYSALFACYATPIFGLLARCLIWPVKAISNAGF